MHSLLRKLNTLKIGWNERAMTEDDFYRLCRRFKVTAVEMPLTVGGFYYRVLGKDHIAIDSRLSGTEKLLVQFHELAHFLLHTPESGATANFHGVGRKTRQEREADMFAICCLIPRTELEQRSADELAADGVPWEVISERLAILERYGL